MQHAPDQVIEISKFRNIDRIFEISKQRSKFRKRNRYNEMPKQQIIIFYDITIGYAMWDTNARDRPRWQLLTTPLPRPAL